MIVGPLYFVIYIDDFSWEIASIKCFFFLFADDPNFFFKPCDPSDLIEESVSHWFRSLNIEKTKLIVFRPMPSDLGHVIEQV